jgi:hypothetical protein
MSRRRLSDFGDLSDAERKLVACCKAGQFCVLGEGMRPEQASLERSIRADLLRFLILGGGEDCEVHEWGVQLRGAHVADLLDLSFAKAMGPTALVNCVFHVGILALQAKFEFLTLSGSFFGGLMAQGAEVTSGIFLDKGFCATAGVTLAHARIGGNLECTEGRFETDTGDALVVQGAKVKGDIILTKLQATARVNLTGAQIGGRLDCTNSRFKNDTKDALSVQSADITGDVVLREVHAHGEVSFSGASIGGLLDCTKSYLENETGRAFSAQRTEVAGGILLTKVQAKGSISLANVKVGGPLFCTDGRFESKIEDGVAFGAQFAQLTGALVWRNVVVSSGLVDFHSAKIATLVDDLGSWAEGTDRLMMDGFGYDRLGPNFLKVKDRLGWLSRGTIWKGEFYPQPYTQLAKVYREMGHNRAAREVLIRREELLAQHQLRQDRERLVRLASGDQSERGDIGFHWLRMQSSRVWSALLRVVVGYGYAPGRVLAWASGIIIAFAMIYLIADQSGGMAPVNERAEDINPFNPFFYAADVFVPFLAFGQETQWNADASTTIGGIARSATYLLSIAGWVLSALGAAAVAGIIKRE